MKCNEWVTMSLSYPFLSQGKSSLSYSFTEWPFRWSAALLRYHFSQLLLLWAAPPTTSSLSYLFCRFRNRSLLFARRAQCVFNHQLPFHLAREWRHAQKLSLCSCYNRFGKLKLQCKAGASTALLHAAVPMRFVTSSCNPFRTSLRTSVF